MGTTLYSPLATNLIVTGSSRTAGELPGENLDTYELEWEVTHVVLLITLPIPSLPKQDDILDQVLSIILIFCKFKKLSKLKYMNLDTYNIVFIQISQGNIFYHLIPQK